MLFMIKLLFDSKGREFVTKWIEYRLNIIDKYNFDRWVTKQTLGE